MKPLITFDLDNTLLNSDSAHVKAYQYALKKLKLPVLKSKDIYIHFGKPKIEVAKAISKSKDKNILNKVTEYHNEYLWSNSYKLSKILPGVESTLKYLKKKYKIVVISNCSHKSIQKLLKGSSLNKKYFDLIIGDTDVKHPKPWPDEIFLAEKLAKQEVLYHIGDSIYDVRAGKKAKVKTIAVLSGHYTRKQLLKEKPHIIIKDLKELKRII